MLYYLLKLYGWYCSHLFFRDISVINPENVPLEGPTIVYGNHNNQFVDGILLMRVLPRPISFIAAAKSCRRTFVGPIIRGTGAIPVERPQDITVKGKGKIISFNKGTLKGQGTEFTKIVKGSQIQLENKSELLVTQVISNEQLRTNSLLEEFEGQMDYKVIPKLEYNDMYSTVWDSLKNGGCIGIFPEGGSHDRMQLLPLKAGICIMALGAMDKHNVPVKLVPCGFNYYNPQKFRSKAILQFGPAYEIPMEMLELYRKDKKKAISVLLQNLQKMLKSVTIEFKSFNQLNALFLCRELYALSGKRQISLKEKLQLNRRFAKGYSLLMQKPQFKQEHEKLLRFTQFVKLTGLPIRRQDYFGSRLVDFFQFIFYLEKFLVRSIVALPGVIMFYPTTSLIAYLSQRERIKCLKGSKVKHYGNDVVGSYKIMVSSILLPLTCAIHSGILYLLLRKFTQINQNKAIKISLLLFALQPIYALLFVKSYDSLKRSIKKLKFMFWRMFKVNIYTDFNREKKEIQKMIMKAVDTFGSEVVENFSENRVLKPEDIQGSASQLFIFDEEKQMGR